MKTNSSNLSAAQSARGVSGRRLHYAFVIVGCCCLMMGINVGLTFSCAGIFYRPVTESLGLSVGGFGLYMTAMYIASSLMLPFAGRMLERYSSRMLFTAASTLNGVALILMGCMSTLAGFYIAGALLGISIAFLLYMSYPTLINRWFHTRMGLMIGICCAASGLGGIIFNPIGGYIIGEWGWRVGYWAFGAIILVIVTPLLALWLRDYPHELGLKKFGEDDSGNPAGSQAAEASSAMGLTYAQVIRMPVFYALIAFAFIMMGCSTLNLFIPGYVQSVGFPLETASMAAASAMAGVTLGKLLLGYINDRNCLLGVLLCTIGGAAGLLAVIWGHSWIAAILVGSFFFGWCYAGVTVQTAMLTKAVVGSRDYARIFSIISIALSAGGAVASGGWGLLADATSYSLSFIVGAGLLLMATLLGLYSLAAARKLRPI
ncbi:MAG: MFS transporter [Muribaculaceae bacterium]|nr:MFS transporter [Muribaculaceae bacterium]